MEKKKVAINGLGRIGRNTLKIVFDEERDFEIVALNDLTDAVTLAHLIKYDSCFGRFDKEVEILQDALLIDGKRVEIFSEPDPEKLPWKKLGVDLVIESTGKFSDRKDALKHIKAGAKKVVLSSMSKDADCVIVMGVNEETYDPAKHIFVSNASCTTNCLAPVAKIIDREFGIERGLMITVHSYTNDQRILDLPHKDLRRARAANLSLIPTTTGAARAVAKVLPQLEGKLNGLAMRVPTPTVSVVDVVFDIEKEATVEDINNALKVAADREMKGILGYTEEPLVSMDFRGDERSSIVDGLSTMVMENKMVKILSWYDNEWGYSNRLADLVSYVIKQGI